MAPPHDSIHKRDFVSNPDCAGGVRSRWVLTINGGSSSLKSAVLRSGDPIARVLSGRVEPSVRGQSWPTVRDAGGSHPEECAVEAPDQSRGHMRSAAVLARGGFLGIALENGRNSSSDPMISTDASPTRVRVIRNDEERMIAKETIRLGVLSS